MYKINREAFHKILTSELGFKPEYAEFYLDHYPALHDELAEAVEAWLKDRTVVDKKVNGVSIKQVMDNQDAHFLSAVRSLNDLLVRDLTDEQRDALKKVLTTPFIRM